MKRSHRLCPVRDAQRGFSLIELMVAVTIGLFVALGLSAIYLNMKQTFSSQQQLAELQDSERLALAVLTTTIESARYFPTPNLLTASTALPAVPTLFVATQGLSGTKGAAGASDTVTSRFVTAPGDTVMDCLGNAQPATATLNRTVVNTFSVAGNSLVCSTTIDGVTLSSSLVGNVTSLKVLYGVDSDSASDDYRSADVYLDAAAVSAMVDGWLSVRTARITLSFQNPFSTAAAPIAWTQTVALMNQLGPKVK
ncbi:Type IV pilus assembly protein PilW [Burkholderiales bacterium 8X]|nr:Type IV pilus assembly protein PilW [Burkholderiales bacterium 8X]